MAGRNDRVTASPPVPGPADSSIPARDSAVARRSTALRSEVWNHRPGSRRSSRVGPQQVFRARPRRWPHDRYRFPGAGREGLLPAQSQDPDGCRRDVCRRLRTESPPPRTKAAEADQRATDGPSCRRRACRVSARYAGSSQGHRAARCAPQACWRGHLRRPPAMCRGLSNDRGWSPTERRHCRRRWPAPPPRSCRPIRRPVPVRPRRRAVRRDCRRCLRSSGR